MKPRAGRKQHKNNDQRHSNVVGQVPRSKDQKMVRKRMRQMFSSGSVGGYAVHNNAVTHVDHPIRVSGGFRIVRDHHDGLAQILFNWRGLPARFRIFGIEIPGRLIRQHHLRLVHHGARNGHTLLLATGKLRRPVMQPAGESQHIRDDFETMRIKAVAINVLGDSNISKGVKVDKKLNR